MRATIAARAAPIAPAYAAALPPPGTGASEESSSLNARRVRSMSRSGMGKTARSVRASIAGNFIRDSFHLERLRERPDDASATGGDPLRCQFRPGRERWGESPNWETSHMKGEVFFV